MHQIAHAMDLLQPTNLHLNLNFSSTTVNKIRWLISDVDQKARKRLHQISHAIDILPPINLLSNQNFSSI